jgi:uncharacterized protein (TIGR01777 family)
MQTIGITGGTGFVGQHLTELLKKHNYRVIIFTRDMHKVSRLENVKYSFWSPPEKKFDVSYLKQLDAVIHLAGASVEQRWTPSQKEKIIRSRVWGTQFLIERLKEHAPQCKTLIAASAIGYYGEDRKDAAPFHEDTNPANDFLATTCQKWEAESQKAAALMRTVILRFGIVLGRHDGAFPQFARPQNLGVVPIIAGGLQTISWIHITDLCRIILWCIENENIRGVYNAVAPHPVSNKRLMDTIAKGKGGIKIPIPVPGIFLKAGLGEVAKEVLKSCTVSADKIQQAGFSFQFNDIKAAVKDILGK